MGINLFMHSVRMVLGDWRNALKLSGLLYLIYAIPSLLLALLFPPPPRSDTASAEAVLAHLPVVLITLLLTLVVFVWIAVAWHRYILLDEAPTGQVPVFNQSRMLSYAGYSVLLGCVMFAASLLIGLVMVPFAVAGGTAVAIISQVLAIFVILVITYRLGPVLPASSIGKPLRLAEAWQATRGATGAIVVLAIVSALASVIIDIPVLVLARAGQVGSIAAMLWALATGWLKLLVGISVLTTLYGHYVEGRAIPAGR